jgi:hypothetical protein
MSENNQSDNQIEKEKEGEKIEENNKKEEKEVIDLSKPTRKKEDYPLRVIPEPEQRLQPQPQQKAKCDPKKGEKWKWRFDTAETEPHFHKHEDPNFHLGDPIDVQEYAKFNIESVNGEKRLFEESDSDDEYVDSLESGEKG